MLTTHITADFSFYDKEIITLYHLIKRCLNLTYDEHSNFWLNSDEYILFGKILKYMNENKFISLHINENE